MGESATLAHVALSVLVPNYNYARYIEETVQSVLAQAGPDIEVIVTDNASTDDSVAVVRALGDPRVTVSVNPCNVGFSANLERVAALARGRRMLLLSSDDRMKPGALAAYARLERALGESASRAVWGSAVTLIDSGGNTTGELPLDAKIWQGAHEERELSRAVGLPVRSMPAAANLRRCLELLRTSLPFASICYPKSLHDQVGGYAGGRLYNPDKWFLWKLLSVADKIYGIETPLFDYRVHSAGQASQEQRSGALKHLTDQYVSTFSLPDAVLERAGLDRDALARAFVEQDIALRGLVALSEGRRQTAQRSVQFGRAAYPEMVRANAKVWLLRGLLSLGPAGTTIARQLRSRIQERWRAEQSRPRP